MASYVVLGATGQTGAAAANALMGQATVRVAVRNESKGAVSFGKVLERDVQAVALPESEWSSVLDKGEQPCCCPFV